jgi:hypothetical protein
MGKIVKLTESDLTHIVKKVIKEQDEYENEYDDDTSDLVECLDCLKQVNNRINRQELIRWFNDNDIDYFTMSDLEMYIHFIEKNAGM